MEGGWMKYWHMQLHPDDLDWQKERDILKDKGVIGLGDSETWPKGERQINKFISEMTINDIVAIKRGAQLIALVQVTGDHRFEPDPDDDFDWFKNRRPIRVLDWNEQGLSLPQPMGTLSQCVNLSNPTSKVIIQWHLQVLMEKAMTEYIDLLKHQKQIILYGPPGTGKTWQAHKITESILGADRFRLKDDWNIVQFHPSYNYEDFVRGVRVTTTSDNKVTYRTENGIFGNMAAKAKSEFDKAKEEKREAQQFVLIIDEINRANLASVLGELIYGLEYRGKAIDTPYELGNNDRSIIVPENLLIIGTMNTADRSIGHIDYAIRRRFAFAECLSDRLALENCYINLDDKLKTKALALFDTVANLFKGENKTLSQDFTAHDVQLGYSYFIAKDEEELKRKLTYQVKPILNEYLRDGVLTVAARKTIDGLSC